LAVPLEYVLCGVGDKYSHAHSTPNKVLAFYIEGAVLTAVAGD
jgi:hypothetical protein